MAGNGTGGPWGNGGGNRGSGNNGGGDRPPSNGGQGPDLDDLVRKGAGTATRSDGRQGWCQQ